MELNLPHPLGRGSRHRRMTKITVAFENDTFEEIRARAAVAGHSFSEEVRVLVEAGLEAAQ